MARIALLPFGSAGDVLPFLWLGKLLRQRGHEITVITASIFSQVVQQAGMEAVAIGQPGDFEQLITDPRLWRLYHGTRLVFQQAGQAVETWLRPLEERATSGPPFDLMLAPCTAFGARLFREKTGTPLLTVHLQPAAILSAQAPPVLFPGMQHLKKLPLPLRRLLLHLPNPADLLAGPAVASACAARGLQPPRSLWWDWSNSPDGVLCLFPEWFAPPQADWPQPLLQWDFPLEDLATQQPIDESLRQFLAQGSAPLIFTAGSANVQAATFFQTAVAITTALQRRAVLVSRTPAQLPSPLPPHITTTVYAPFSQLLPQAAAFIHHGGIGTLSQGFAAGIPQLIVPMAHDQPDNASRLTHLGAGMAMAPPRFTPERATSALHQLLTTPSIARAAADCREKTLHRRPLESLIRWIESRLPAPKP
jgi:rhamnosyltransferase subunit B